MDIDGIKCNVKNFDMLKREITNHVNYISPSMESKSMSLIDNGDVFKIKKKERRGGERVNVIYDAEVSCDMSTGRILVKVKYSPSRPGEFKRDFGFLMERFKVERYEIEKMKDGCTSEEMS